MLTSDKFVIVNGGIAVAITMLLYTDEVTLEMVARFFGFLLKSGIVYAYLGYWGVVALLEIGNGLDSGCAHLSKIRSDITDFNYVYKKKNE